MEMQSDEGGSMLTCLCVDDNCIWATLGDGSGVSAAAQVEEEEALR